MPTVCQRVRYEGHVQGVGFRATAQHLAAAYPISGYVRNLPTGEVELVAEGEAPQVQAFLTALAGRMGAHITRATVHPEQPAGHTGFRIRH